MSHPDSRSESSGTVIYCLPQRSLEQRAVVPGVPGGGWVPRSAGGAGLCSGLSFSKKKKKTVLNNCPTAAAHLPLPAGDHQSAEQRGLIIREQEGLPLRGLSAGVQCPRTAAQRGDPLARWTQGRRRSGEVCPAQAAAGCRGGLAAG